MNSDLTLLLFENCERRPEHLERYLGALGNWNRKALPDVQLVIITQKPDGREAEMALRRHRIEAEVIKAGNPFVGNKPIWDVMTSLRKAWPRIRGRYITFNHTEFIWCKDRLAKTVRWLREQPYYLALGNLMRPASRESMHFRRPRWRPGNCEKTVSDLLTGMIDLGKWEEAAMLAETLPTACWPLWHSQGIKYGATRWQEDAFFVDKQWLESWDAINLGGDLPFQDIWDLMGIAVEALGQFQLAPPIFRLPQAINRIIHSWHDKPYSSWTPEIRDWFMRDASRWRGTCMTDPAIWRGLISLNGQGDNASNQPKYDVRRGPGGTVTRYAIALQRHMRNSGRQLLAEFYKSHGREKRMHANA